MPPADEASTRLVRLAMRRTGRARVPVEGTSMLPTIRPSTMVTIEDRPFRSVRPGQIVAYAHGEGIIVHRVVGREPARLFTLGDNLPLYDPPVPESAYLGVLPDYPCRTFDRMARLPEPNGPVGGEVIVWTATSGRHEAAPALEVRPLSLHDGPTTDVRIGVSPEGALPVRAIPRILAAVRPRRVHVILGCAFGNPRLTTATRLVLPPEAADFHVRMGEPFQDVDPASAIRRISVWATTTRTGRRPPGAELPWTQQYEPSN